jgi:hypothetical protein
MINDQIKYLQSDEYKKKYEDLLKRCAEFTKEFSPPTDFERGFKCGWEMAEKSLKFNADKTHVPDTTKQHQPAKTMDIQWPKDNYGITYTDHSVIPCHTCGIDLSKLPNYMCMLSNCPSQIKTSNINLGIHT